MPTPLTPKSCPPNQQNSTTKASIMTRQVISRPREPSSASNPTSSCSTTHANIQSTPANNNTSSTPAVHTRYYTSHKRRQFSSSTPLTPRSTPCPQFQGFPNPFHLQPPYIPPFATLPSLEAERIDLLTALQHADHESTAALGAMYGIQQQLDFPNPLSPVQVRELRRGLRIQRNRVEARMRRERGILGRLGEIAFQVQQIRRWERVSGWDAGVGMRPDGMAPPAMGPEKAFENGFSGPMMKQWEQQAGAMQTGPQTQMYPMQGYGAQSGDFHASQPQADSAYSNSNVMSSPPVAVQPEFWEQGYGSPGYIAPLHSRPNGQPPTWFDTTSGVTSAATTRRNTMFPTSTPLNSRHGSIAQQSHAILGLDLGNRMAMLAQSSEDGYVVGKPPAPYRRSEPGLLVGQWSGETRVGGYEYAQSSAQGSSLPGADLPSAQK